MKDMKKSASMLFLFFYVASTLVVPRAHTRIWLDSLNGFKASHSAAVQSPMPLAKQTRIAETAFILYQSEDAAALPHVDSGFVFVLLEPTPAPSLLNIPPRSPPTDTALA